MKVHYILLGLGVWLFEISLTLLPYVSTIYNVYSGFVGGMLLTLSFLVCGTLTIVYSRNMILREKEKRLCKYSHMSLIEHEVEYSSLSHYDQNNSGSKECESEKTWTFPRANTSLMRARHRMRVVFIRLQFHVRSQSLKWNVPSFSDVLRSSAH